MKNAKRTGPAVVPSFLETKVFPTLTSSLETLMGPRLVDVGFLAAATDLDRARAKVSSRSSIPFRRWGPHASKGAGVRGYESDRNLQATFDNQREERSASTQSSKSKAGQPLPWLVCCCPNGWVTETKG